MHVKPAPGFVIRDIDLLDLLPPEGREVPDSGYWRRRLRDGDVVLSQAPAPPPAPSPAPEPDPDPPASESPAERRKASRS